MGIKYEGAIYRPPSEAYSLLIQVTIGCAWNKCTFCDMYKEKSFRVRSMDEIRADLQAGAQYAGRVKRIFLCDGDAMALSADKLFAIMEMIREYYPGLQAVRAYASAKDILAKSQDELDRLRKMGLDMVYIGLESGSDKVLRDVNKGITKAQMIAAANMLKKAGIKQSVSIIAGLGGEADSREHILETADCLNQMQPEYLGMLVLYVGEDALLFDSIQNGYFRLPTPAQVLQEMELLVQNLELEDCYFTSAHISNYIHVKGALPADKPKLLATLAELRRQPVPTE